MGAAQLPERRLQSALARLLGSLGVVRAVLRNANLRRVELAFVGFNTAEWGTWIAILVFAYEQGGPTATAVIAVIQLAPAAVFAPLVAVVGDRYRRERVLSLGYLSQALILGMTAAALLVRAPLAVIYALAALAATSITVTRPVQAALLPSLARTPEELTAANVIGGWIESLSMLIGPAAAALLLGVTSPGAVFAVMAAVVGCSALLAARVQASTTASVRRQGAATAPFRNTFEGFRTLTRQRRPRVLTFLLAAQFIVIGALDVLLVVLAFELLHTGSSGAAVLNAAFGAGGILGIAATVLLVGRPRLAPALLAGAVTWGLALLAVGLDPGRVTAPMLLAAAGAGRSLMDVAGRTLLQRVVPNQVLSRVFGMLEGLSMAALGLGSMLAPALVAAAGTQLAVVLIALLLPALSLAVWRRLAEADATTAVPAAELALLRSLPMFAPLPAQVIERLATNLVTLEVPAGTIIIRQGDPGDRFYVVADGEVVASIDDAPVRQLGVGAHFGEIALLRNVARTATVKAQSKVRLYALDREAFLEAVAGNARSAALAEAIVSDRLRESARAKRDRRGVPEGSSPPRDNQ